ncbi:ARID/BRIGHT DNA binding domain-containing protein [Phanerochaete sordida]|uniref:ARID/BRIGHT DNA binding domain-containing protein n=1 Tax=Phanerochaete sordida TaxID=48140 RepID=A0A9P3G168_9APHY|nr:ARID/BRIGHT DNA binding domain-containing protein [Phanerochaete sordida]
MLPQPQGPFSPAQPPVSPDGALSFNNLDPYTAKQMAALQATSLAKAGNRYAPGGGTSASSYFGGLSTHQLPRTDSSSSAPELASFPPSISAQQQGAQGPSLPSNNMQNMQNMQNMNPAVQQQRRKQFLIGLGNVMLQRNVPLPPQLTGMPYPPGYDPSTSPWRSLEVSNADIGVFRLAGKDIDMFRLWAVVSSAGGSGKLNQQGMWGQLLQSLDLPEQHMSPSGQMQSTASTLQHYYMQLLGPFEEAYRKNQMRDPQRMQGRPQPGFPMPGGAQGRPPSMGGMPGTFPPVGSLPATNGVNGLDMMGQPMGGGNLQVPDLPAGGLNVPFATGQAQISQRHGSQPPIPNGLHPMTATASMSDLNGAGSVDLDMEGRKRKIEETDEGKRARQKLGEATNVQPTPAPTRTIRQPSRRKIEYVPLAREVESAGGRDLDAIQQEYTRVAQRPMKDLNDWGTVDMEALTLSLRSRLSHELSYALTTISVVTLMPYKQYPSFPIAQTPDLFEELLDVLEETAFSEAEEDMPRSAPHKPIVTHRHLIKGLIEEGTDPFASLKHKQGFKDSKIGPGQRPGDIAIAITNILRNLAIHHEINAEFLAKHDRVLSLLLRLSSLKLTDSDSTPSPLSPILTTNDLVTIRRDVINILLHIGFAVRFSSSNIRDARRAIELCASYLVDPVDAIAPWPLLFSQGLPANLHPPKPPTIIDTALEAFTRLSHPDDNRQVLFAAIPEDWLWELLVSLVHRLPVENSDFGVIQRADWLAYLERVMMAIYSIAFLASPALKQRVKADRQLAFTKVMLRVVKKFTIYATPETRVHFTVAVRRAVEALKLVDEAGDSFDVTPSTMPTLAFGMGYGEHGESRVEKGMGLLSGYQEEITWGLMMQREVDDLLFMELSSLVRVQPE